MTVELLPLQFALAAVTGLLGALIGARTTLKATETTLREQREAANQDRLRARRHILEAAKYELDLDRDLLDGDLRIEKAAIVMPTGAIDSSIEAWPDLEVNESVDELRPVMVAYHALLRYNSVAEYVNANPTQVSDRVHGDKLKELASTAIKDIGPAVVAIDKAMGRLWQQSLGEEQEEPPAGSGPLYS